MTPAKPRSSFYFGMRAMLPITTGVLPFGAVMGTVSSEAGLSLFQAATMNLIVYAGAAQLAAVDLMSKHAASIVVIATGLVINLRFLLYSAAMSPVVQNSSLLVKLTCAHTLTDQSYTTMTANSDRLPTTKDQIQFYFGASLIMFIAWQASVIAGFIFGNFAPAAWALDFAVPLSFVALLIPTLKNKTYVYCLWKRF